MAQSSAHLPYSYARHLPLKPLSTEQSPYSWFRLPLPADTTVPPGAICWGTVGEMPSPVPLRAVDFNVATETSRKSSQVRIENPDDPMQYIEVERADEMVFGTVIRRPMAGANTASLEAAGLAAYDDKRRYKFETIGGIEVDASQVTVKYKYPPPS